MAHIPFSARQSRLQGTDRDKGRSSDTGETAPSEGLARPSSASSPSSIAAGRTSEQRSTKRDQDLRQRRKMLLVGGQDLTDLETQGRPQRLRPRGSRGRSTPPKVGSITSYQNGLLHFAGFPFRIQAEILPSIKYNQVRWSLIWTSISYKVDEALNLKLY